MLIALPLSMVSLLLAAFASDRAYRQRRGTRRARGNDPEQSGHAVPVLVRTGRIGEQLARPVRATAEIAPAASPDEALRVVDATGQVLESVGHAQVVMARGWSDGALVLEYRRTRESYSAPWPAGRNIAGWELHLVTTTGESIRCYGAPGTTLNGDLARLSVSLPVRLLRAG